MDLAIQNSLGKIILRSGFILHWQHVGSGNDTVLMHNAWHTHPDRAQSFFQSVQIIFPLVLKAKISIPEEKRGQHSTELAVLL